MEIAVRAYVPTRRLASKRRTSDLGPSEWALIFDTETTTDSAQALKFGVYQVRKGPELWEAGIFLNPLILTNAEKSKIRSFAAKNNYRCMTVAEFIENVFFRIGYELRATIVGFNLPFDISRLAINHGPARGRTMKGGFSFQLSANRNWPNIQIKHLNNRVSLIRFTTRPGFIAGRGMRRRKIKPTPRPGYFIDVRTLAAALTSRSFDLAGLADFLGTPSQKLRAAEHGQSITDNYLVYAKQDVQVTWECYCALLRKFEDHEFAATQPHRIFSEASIGKAYFKEMNIRPWREAQPDFPEYLTGIIISTYFGGRAEVHHRRIISQVRYCDFLSMYPTVCTLMGLWRFVIAKGVRWRDSTAETTAFLQSITIEQLQSRNTWHEQLTTIVQVQPDADIFPVRANYGEDDQHTIGLNFLSSEIPFWFTLADCIASKLLTGKTPHVLRAITFEPGEPQKGLRPVKIARNPDYRIDPYRDDFYRRVIDLRASVKTRLKNAAPSERAVLDSEQLSLKILANATSYGNFVEINVEDLSRPQRRTLHGYSGEPLKISTDKSEQPGRYFHPLIATLITGAARLMLAITERLSLDYGLDWTFCDTDSMAIARPSEMAELDFAERVGAIRRWFEPLNPYAEKGSILKLEDANYRIVGGKLTQDIEPLYCLAVSAKRYALFNIGPGGRIIIRKASAHGLGHLLPSYDSADAPGCIPPPAIPLAEIGVKRWQYDFWHKVIRAVLDGHPDQVDLTYHPSLALPAASRYAATTPKLLRWFGKHNQNRPYPDQVKPSNFLLAYQIAPDKVHDCPELFEALTDVTSDRATPIRWPKPAAPYDTDPARAAKNCFDRDTGMPIPVIALKTYAEALAQYPLRPEHKFQNGNYTDRGITMRRHVTPLTIRQIGKESNRWEERSFVGDDDGAEIDYGAATNSEAMNDALRAQIIAAGQRRVARDSGVARRTIERLLAGRAVHDDIRVRIAFTLRKL
ncbi:MAG: hypothetical protein ACLQJ0_20780 [Steroidobacteraceae bacterium]